MAAPLRSLPEHVERDEAIARIESFVITWLRGCVAGGTFHGRSNRLRAIRTAAGARADSRFGTGLPPLHSQDATEGAGTLFVSEQETSVQRKGLPEIRVVSRAPSNTRIGSDGRLQLNGRTEHRIATVAGSGGKRYCRMLLVIGHTYAMLVREIVGTQRDLFYRLASFFAEQRECDAAIQDVTAATGVPRRSLNITTAPKGFMAIRALETHDATGRTVRFGGPDAELITDQTVLTLRSAVRMSSTARYLLIIEKQGILQTLVEQRFHLNFPCIMVCGVGFPDLLSRKAAHAICVNVPGILPVGIFDLNSGGTQIYLTWRLGSAAMGLESPQYALTSLKWAGLHVSDVENLQISQLAMIEMSEHEKMRTESLLRSPILADPRLEQIKDEVKKYLEFGNTVELQSLAEQGQYGVQAWVARQLSGRIWIE